MATPSGAKRLLQDLHKAGGLLQIVAAANCRQTNADHWLHQPLGELGQLALLHQDRQLPLHVGLLELGGEDGVDGPEGVLDLQRLQPHLLSSGALGVPDVGKHESLGQPGLDACQALGRHV